MRNFTLISKIAAASASGIAIVIGSVLPASATLATPDAVIESGGWSTGLAHDGEYLYNALLAQSKVLRIDPATNTIVDTFSLPAGSQPYEMTIVDGYLYTANFWNMSNSAPGTISRIDLSTGDVVGAWATLSNGFNAEWITSNSTEIFVSGNTGKVARIPIDDPAHPTELTATYNLTTDLVVSGNYLYVAGANNTHGGVIRINLSDNTIESQWALADVKVVGIAVVGDYIYAGEFLSHKVAKIRKSDGVLVSESAALTSGPWIMTYGGGILYISQLNGDVSTVDISDLSVLGNPFASPLPGNTVVDATPFMGSLWVSSYYPNNKVYRYGLVNVPTVAPASQNPTAKVGESFSTEALTATNFGSDVTYSISPSLPAGLTINPNTGQITGTPTSSSPLTTYTITATGTDIVTATVSFEVVALPATLATTGFNAVPTLFMGGLLLIGAAVLTVPIRRRSQWSPKR